MRKIDSVPSLINFLKTIDEMPEPRIDKCKTLYRLAAETYDGEVIVELGTYHGIGAISLAAGTKSTSAKIVVTVDPFDDITGWAGEAYSPKDETVFRKNVEKSGFIDIILIKNYVEDWVIQEDPHPIIGLLVWDTGTENAEKHFLEYSHMICEHGCVAFHDTNDCFFKTDDLCQKLVDEGKYAYWEKLPGGFNVARNHVVKQ